MVDIFSVSDSCVICVSSCTGTRVCVLAACVGVGVHTRGERTEHHTGQASTCSLPPGRGHTSPADRQEGSQGAGLVFEPSWFEGRVGCLGQSQPGEEGGSVHVLCLAACPWDGSALRGRPHPTGLSQHPALLQGLRKEKTQPRAHPGLRAVGLPPEGSLALGAAWKNHPQSHYCRKKSLHEREKQFCVFPCRQQPFQEQQCSGACTKAEQDRTR